MEQALLDTDMVSEIWRGKNAMVRERSGHYRQEFGQYTTSVITVIEVVRGFAKGGREEEIEACLDRFATEEVLAVDYTAAVLAGRIYGTLERTGQPIGRADPMIAAIALRHGLTLVTGNTDHFQRIVDLGFPLRLVNWRL